MKKIQRMILIVMSFVLLMALLSACAKKNEQEELNNIATSVVETLDMGLTRTAIARPSDTPVPTPTMMPTNTMPVLPTQPPVDTTAVYGITQSPIPQTTPQSTTPTVAAGAVERADWAATTPKDGTLIDGGSKFKVNFSIVNNGTTTWNTNYYVQHVDGPKLSDKTKVNMPSDIPPGMSAQFELEFTAPTTAGTVKSNWAVYNANNVVIGVFYFEYKID